MVLQTKLFIPRCRPGAVRRARLVERLNAQTGQQITLISAPAGFGKTTLLAEWVPTSQQCVTWVSLDQGDNDPTRFWGHFIAALQRLDAGLGQSAQQLLELPQPPPIEALLSLTLNDVSACPVSFVHVFDDYHFIENPAIDQALTFLLEHLPPNLYVIIASRADPALPLARWRGRGQLVELRAADLRFTIDEVGAFLNGARRLSLSDAQIAALENRTEGWIASLQLAALSMQGHRDSSGFIRAFTGSNRFVLAYLAEEVLSGRSEATLSFLLRTSILDRLSGPLCDAVTGRSGSQAILEELEHENLFVIPLDEERKWYRYHHLFAEVLRARLQQSEPELLQDLHRRASEWYEGHGSTSEAVSHALVAQDFEQAARLIEQTSRAMWQHGEVVTLQGWLAALPTRLRRTRPQLALVDAWAAFAAGRITVVESRILEAEAAMSQQAEMEVKPLLAQVDALRSTLANLRQDSALAIELAKRSLMYLPEGEHVLRGHLAYNLGWAYLSRGDVPAAGQKLREAAAFSLSEGNLSTASLALNALGAEMEAQGQLHEAASCYRQAIQAVQNEGRPLPVTAACGAYARLGGILYEWNQLEEAAQCANLGIELNRPFQASGIVFASSLVLTRIHKAHGDLTGAINTLEHAETAALSGGISTATLRMVKAVRAQLWLAQSNLVDAAQWATAYERELNVPTGSDWPDVRMLRPIFDYECLTLARVRMAQARWDEALSLLARFQPVVEAGTRKPGLIELHALRALSFQAQTRNADSVAALEHALSLAEPEGYIRVFVDEGQPMRRLISDYRLRSEAAPQALTVYLDKLLAAFVQPLTTASQRPPIAHLERLRDRELEVLRLIAQGYSNHEIAHRLVLGLSTIKTHINNLFRKLDVTSRTQAIARARELGLL